MNEGTNYWVCADCADLLANQQVHVEGGIIEFGHDHATCGHDEFAHDEITECETKTFSSLPCDACGSTLGGYRFGVSFMKVEAKA